MAQTLEHNKEVTTVVPVTIPAFDDDLNIIQKLDDEPNDVGGLTAAELKAKFDEGNLSAQQYINNVLIPTVVADDLSEQARQAAEAERVANEIDRVTNEQAREKAEEERVNETSGVVALATAQAEAAAESARKATQAALGQIVDGSLEPAKFSGESRSMMVRENLLDNAYFGNPVNQRGQTEYTGAGYTIDRWRAWSDKAVAAIHDNYLHIEEAFIQYIEHKFDTLKKVGALTCSYLDKDGVLDKATVFFGGEGNSFTGYFERGGYFYIGELQGYVEFIFHGKDEVADIAAIKLELGSEQTLAHQENGVWVLNEIPNYAEELAKCQYYFRRINRQYLKVVHLASGVAKAPIALDGMRGINPAVVIVGTPATFDEKSWASVSGASVNTTAIHANGTTNVTVEVTSTTTLTTLDFVVSDLVLDVSADL